MKLKEIMSENVETVSAESSVMRAANKMARLNIGFLPVVNEQGIVGVVTDRDIAVRFLGEGRDPIWSRIGDFMTREVIILSEDQDVEDAAEVMQAKRIRRILVRGPQDRYVGVISLSDLAIAGNGLELSGRTLAGVCSPATSKTEGEKCKP